MEILTHLEPRHELKGSILFEELEEVNEVIFVSRGNVDIGYEINKQKKYVVRLSDNIVIGAYNCAYNVRTLFVYKCYTECHGYSIRKENWADIMNKDEFSEIAEILRKNITHLYNFKIKKAVLKAKNQHIQKISQRKDFTQIMVIAPNSEETHIIASQQQSKEPGEYLPAMTIRDQLLMKEEEKVQQEQEQEEALEADELETHLEWYNKKMNKFGNQICDLLHLVECVLDVNKDLAKQLNNVQTDLANERIKN